MVLIIGGAYQGKLDYAREAYSLQEGEILHCTGQEPDFSRRCIWGLENYVLACVRQDRDPIAHFRQNREKWQGSILICRDLSSGVVPLEQENRRWRQETGRLCRYLAGEAAQVSRIFCGLEQRLK